MVGNLKIGGNLVRIAMTFSFTTLKKIPWDKKGHSIFLKESLTFANPLA